MILMVHKNPFVSGKFTKIWGAHFNKGKEGHTFDFIEGLTFFKHPKFPLYINMGQNLTKGVSYDLNPNSRANDFKGKVFLIYDVPHYFNVNTLRPKDLNIKKIKQYPGFLINKKNYVDFDAYLKKTFSKSSIQKLNRYNKRLERCFDIKEKMLIGPIEKTEYHLIFDHFKALLTKRFKDKQITNNNLSLAEWAFYEEVVYPLILEKKAALHVIYNSDTPISVRLLYFSENIVFDAITVFDIDYSKFHLGKVSIMKILEWSFKSDFSIFDFSKGYYDYKTSWSDLKYDFEYHILYDSKSLIATISANAMAAVLRVKQYLRERDIHEKLHKTTYFLRKKETEKEQKTRILQAATILYKKEDLVAVNILSDYAYLKKDLFDFAFLSSEPLKNIQTFKINNQTKECFLFKATKQNILIGVEN